MNEKLLLIVMSILLPLILWLFINYYVNPGKAIRWQAAGLAPETIANPEAQNTLRPKAQKTLPPVPENAMTAEATEAVSETQEEHGITVTLQSPTAECTEHFGAGVQASVMFRANTAAIKSESLIALERMVAMYHDCKHEGIWIESTENTKKAPKSVQQRRLDEVRYYLMHMRVAKTDIQLADKL